MPPRERKVRLPVLGPGLRSPGTFYHLKCIKTVTGLLWVEHHTHREGRIDGINVRTYHTSQQQQNQPSEPNLGYRIMRK